MTYLPEYLTQAEVAERLHTTVGTLTQWRHKGRGPKYVKFGGAARSKVLYRVEDIIAYEAEAVRDPRERVVK